LTMGVAGDFKRFLPVGSISNHRFFEVESRIFQGESS